MIPGPQRWSNDQAFFHLASGGWAEIDRRTSTTKLIMEAPPPDEALVHPHLAVTAAVVANWMGGTSFHGGALHAGDGAWGLLGEREDGKSSSLGWCAGNGVGVLADDLLVVHGTTALAGPRCVDLRQSAARHLGVGEDIGVVGTRRRWRVALGAVPAEVPLAGWVVLSWGDTVEVRRLPPGERFARLVAHRGLRLNESTPEQWTKLLALPMVELRRPQDWSRIDEAMTQLLDELSR